MSGELSIEEFDALFDTFRSSAFRLETLPGYAIDAEAEELRLWREGKALPEYSVRADAWSRRIAETTLAGRRWQRVHVVDRQLTDYLRWELWSQQASVAVGEEIRIAERDAHPEIAQLTEDFWGFDLDTDDSVVVWMRYDRDGRWISYDRSERPEDAERCRRPLHAARRVPRRGDHGALASVERAC